MDSATLIGIVDRLEAVDLVARQPNPADRRANLICLTARGRAVPETLHGLMAAANGEFLTALSSEERSTMLALLRRLQTSSTNNAGG